MIKNNRSLLLLSVRVLVEFQEDLDDSNEELEQVNEKHHGVGRDILVASLCSLYDHLGIVDNIDARQE
jgi:hypothetical protein